MLSRLSQTPSELLKSARQVRDACEQRREGARRAVSAQGGRQRQSSSSYANAERQGCSAPTLTPLLGVAPIEVEAAGTSTQPAGSERSWPMTVALRRY